MAKVKGPLMSLEASGSVANTLVFSIWKGRPYVRELVTPSNPQTASQVAYRGQQGTLAKAAAAVLTAKKDAAGYGSLFFKALRDNAESGQSWISTFMRIARARFDSVSGEANTGIEAQSARWESIAEGLNLVDYTAVGPTGSTYTAKMQAYHLASYAKVQLGSTIIADLQDLQAGEVAAFIAYVSASEPD